MPPTTGSALWARMLMAATPPAWAENVLSPLMLRTTGSSCLVTESMPRTVWLISAALGGFG